MLPTEHAEQLVARMLVGKDHLDPALEYPIGRLASLLRLEFAWAAHLGLAAVIIKLADLVSLDMCRVLNECLSSNAGQTNVWVQVPMSGDSWDKWNRIRTLCNGHPSLSLALEVGEDLPPDFSLEQWLAEPVKTLILPRDIFVTNQKGFPVLSRPHQAAIKRFLLVRLSLLFKEPILTVHVQSTSTLILSGLTRPDLDSRAADDHVQYLSHLVRANEIKDTTEKFVASYFDILLTPLQVGYFLRTLCVLLIHILSRSR